MEDSLVVEEGMLVKFPMDPLATCLLHLQLLPQGYFHQEEVKQPHCRDPQKNQHDELTGASLGTRSPATYHPFLFARTVQPL